VARTTVENLVRLFAAAVTTPGAVLIAGVEVLVRAMSEMQVIVESGLGNLATGKHTAGQVMLQSDGVG